MNLPADSVDLFFNLFASNIPLLALWFFLNRKIRRDFKWHQIGTLKRIIIYPLKSGKGVDLSEGNCCRNGLKESRSDNFFPLQDRYIVIYNAETKMFVNMKTHFKLTFIKVESISQEEISLSAPDFPSLILRIPMLNNQEYFTMFNDESIKTVDCGLAASQWITSYLNDGITYKLGIWPKKEALDRDEIPTKWKKLISVYPHISKNYTGVYADLAGFMAICEASVEDLKEKVKDSDVQISHRNFRPNLVFSDMKAFNENDYEWFKIGETAVFHNFKPCTRCLIITLDPDTGEKSAHAEPLKTLRQYRAVTNPEARAVEKNAPIFGTYLGLIQAGHIKIGDPVYGCN